MQGGDLAELWKILRVTRQDTMDLCTGWLVACYFSGVPRPGIWPTGAPGSGKTTLGGGLARLVDGTEWLDGRLDRSDERNNIVRAKKCYVVTFDNMSAVTADLSDWICQLVTGHSSTFRRMRTNFADVSMGYRRTFAATGLALPYGLGDDALDRVTEVPLDPIPDGQRVSDGDIRRELDAARPRLLGALLDHVCAVLRELPATPGGHARMDGYARILAAHDTAYGTGCLKAFLAAAHETQASRAEHDPVIATLARLFAAKSPAWCKCGCGGANGSGCSGTVFDGTAATLHDLLRAIRGSSGQQQDQWWPGSPRALSDRLTAATRSLSAAGFVASRHKSHGAKLIRVERPGGSQGP